VVDDSEINREVACQILKGEGANVEVAENGAVAIMQLKARPDYFHLVLMDVQMPVMDGYAATQAIREIPELSHLPIIALTAGAFKSQRVVALDLGMDDFVAKPFDVNELVACIIRLVKRRQNGKTSLFIPETVAPIQVITFDELPLFDVEQGLKKWRNVEFYQKYLRSFLQQHAQDAEHIHHEYQKGDNIAALVIIHKLVGVAGALSLKRVGRFAADIEAALNEQLDAEELILRFAPILSQTIDAINVYLKSESQPQIEQINFQNISNAVITELEQLIESLNSNNPELIEPRLFALSVKLPKQQFDKILSAVEAFDFLEARIISKTLVAEIVNNKKE
jgi:CheY-like chemotaxis protein